MKLYIMHICYVDIYVHVHMCVCIYVSLPLYTHMCMYTRIFI